MVYTLDEHRHRFAAWSAARAASASTVCRFKAALGVDLIDEIGLPAMARSWDTMPAPEYFNSIHRDLRHRLVRRAPDVLGDGLHRRFTHGVAAKLINVYLKTACIGALPADHPQPESRYRDKLNAIHPPIDRDLLTALKAHRVGGLDPLWARLNKVGWSSFDSEQYEHAIHAIRDVTDGVLWRIEQFRAGQRHS